MHIPGSKYIANRVLLMSALTNGVSRITNVPRNTDMTLLLRFLESIGSVHDISESDSGVYEINGIYSRACNPGRERLINAGESGTLLRFALGVSTLLPGKTGIVAGVRNSERPLKPLLKSLRDLGASIEPVTEFYPFPLMVRKGLTGGNTVINGGISSQFISSILIAAPYAKTDVEIIAMKPVVSSYYIDLTIREMELFGVTALRYRNEEFDVFTVKAGQRYNPRNMAVPGDWSSVNYLLAASVILNRGIKISGMNVESNPGESEFLEILGRLGCRISIEPGSVSFQKSELISGIEVDMKDSPDSVLALIAIALFARGTTVIKNIGHLIYKESNRIKHVEEELKKIGADIETTEDSIIVKGRKELHAATAETRNDHRLAMCLGLIQLKNRDMKIIGRECVEKSFPEFWDYLRKIDEGGEKCLVIQ